MNIFRFIPLWLYLVFGGGAYVLYLLNSVNSLEQKEEELKSQVVILHYEINTTKAAENANTKIDMLNKMEEKSYEKPIVYGPSSIVR